ncbi:MAG: hypothetical protein AB4426_02375 [Xenococcaceae cyanobacterium]
MAEKIENRQQWLSQLLETMKSAIELAEYDFALQVANDISQTDYQIVALRQVAQKYALSGKKEKAAMVLSQAFQIAETIEDARQRKQVLTALAQQQQKVESSR